MTLDELRSKLAEREKFCLEHPTLAFEAKVGLMMPSPKYNPRVYPKRVRTPFGLCDWMPTNSEEMILIYPTLAQVRNYLQKAGTTP